MKIHRKENDWQPGQNAFEDQFSMEVLPPKQAEELMNAVVAKFKENAPSRKIITCHITIPPASICISYTEE